MTVYETDEIIERVILVGVAFDTDDDTERLLMNLESLPRQQVHRPWKDDSDKR